MSGKTLLKIAVCICQEVTFSDFIPPMEILGWINNMGSPPPIGSGEDLSTHVEIHYLAPKVEPIFGLGPFSVGIMPSGTYAEAMKKKIQYDIIWVPAGPLPDPVTKSDRTPQEEIDFIRQQAPGAKYVMSVCAGSSILAAAGVLEGKRATTNKALYREITAMHKNRDITWVAKARWVIDGKTWTSSGVTAGSDMALCFVEHLVGKKASEVIRDIVEIRRVESSEDDPFAVVHGLV